MSRHSDGPWEWAPGDSCIYSANGGAVCHIAEHGNVRTIIARGEDFSSADARLIAAAPELLEALRVSLTLNEEYAELQHNRVCRETHAWNECPRYQPEVETMAPWRTLLSRIDNT